MKKISAPKTYNPGAGRPREHLAYLNKDEMHLLRRFNGNNQEQGPSGLPSFPPADATSGPNNSGYGSGGTSSGSGNTSGVGGGGGGGGGATGTRGSSTGSVGSGNGSNAPGNSGGGNYGGSNNSGSTNTGIRGPTNNYGDKAMTGSGSNNSGWGSNTTSVNKGPTSSGSNNSGTIKANPSATSTNWGGTNNTAQVQNPSRGITAGAAPSSSAPLGQKYYSSTGPGTNAGPTPGSSRLGTAGLNAATGPITQPRDSLGAMPSKISPESYGWASTGPSRLAAHVANDVMPESLVRQAANFSQDEIDTLLGSQLASNPDLYGRVSALDPQKRTAATALVTAANRYGVPVETALGMGSIESALGTAPNRLGSQYQGLTQMGRWEFGAYGNPDSQAIGPNDPWASAQAGLNYMAENNERFRSEFGREPTLGDTYGMHQQGYAGYTSLRANPSALAKDVIGAEKVLANGGNLKMTAGEFADHVGQQPVTAMAQHIPGVSETRVASEPVQPQTPSGTQAIPSPSGRLGQSQNMVAPTGAQNLPPPGFMAGPDPYAGRTAPPAMQQVPSAPISGPGGGMSFNPPLPGPMSAEQRMGISLPPALPPPGSMPGVLNPATRQFDYAQYDPLSSVSVPPQQVASAPPRNPVGGMSFTPGLPGPQERVTAIEPFGTIPDSGRMLNPPGFTSPPISINDTGRRLTVASQPTFNPSEDPEETSVSPGQQVASPSQELVPQKKIDETAKTFANTGKAMVNTAAPGFGFIGEWIGDKLGRAWATRGERQKIATSGRLAELNARAINEKASGTGLYVRPEGLQAVFRDPNAVLQNPQSYTRLERMMAQMASGTPNAAPDASMAYLEKLSRGYQPYDNTYVSSY